MAKATVSGENGRIVFVRAGDIYVVEPDGSAVTNLTNHPATDSEPHWSPDGRSLAFVSDRGGSPGIYSMNADGGDVRLLGSGTGPEWSPNGRSLAFVSDRSIWVMNADGSGRQRLTRPMEDRSRVGSGGDLLVPVGDVGPTWHPSGDRIAFTREFVPYDRLFLVIALAGGPATEIGWRVNEYVRDWSPDGTRLVGEWEPYWLTFAGGGLWIMDADGTDYTRIPKPSAVIDMSSPAWSPTGDKLVLQMSPDVTKATANIATVTAGGEVIEALTDPLGIDTSPNWQPVNPYPVGLVDPSTGIWHLRDEAGAVSSFYYGDPGDEPFVGDWDCDGVPTPGLYRRTDGYVYLRNSNSQGIADVRFFFGNPNDIPVPGDFDGDGCDTVSLYRPSEQTFYIIDRLGRGDAGLGAADYSFQFGDPGDKPFAGDFNGDGVDDVALHRESSGQTFMRLSLTTGPADLDFVFGDPGDRLVAGDWNRDGSESPAVYRPSSATFYFIFNNDGGVADAQFIWGRTDWIPVPAYR